MSFTFSMYYKPAYQKRAGDCTICHQKITAGSQVMIGTGYFNGRLIHKRAHFDCWLEAAQKRAREWFFKNEYVPTAMDSESRAELNRLRAKRYYINKMGGEPDEVKEKLDEIGKKIQVVKSKKESRTK